MSFVASMVVSALTSKSSGSGSLMSGVADMYANMSATNGGLDKDVIKKAEDDERRRKRNLRGRELIGIANLNNGLGGIKNILGG